MMESKSASEDISGQKIPYGWAWTKDPFSQQGYGLASFLGFVTRLIFGLFSCLFSLFLLLNPISGWFEVIYYRSGLEVGRTQRYFEPLSSSLGRIVVGLLFFMIGAGILWIAVKYTFKEYQLLRRIEKAIQALNNKNVAQLQRTISFLNQADEISISLLRLKPWALATLVQLWEEDPFSIKSDIQQILLRVSNQSIKDLHTWKEILENSPIKEQGFFERLTVK
jgi:hypothetical protein